MAAHAVIGGHTSKRGLFFTYVMGRCWAQLSGMMNGPKYRSNLRACTKSYHHC